MPEYSGKITTFYSFKGGVGRTMALANIAFLAAHNGLKVLMMDWDLEAPGLEYYFRGLRDRPPERMDEEPGILDVLWRWRREVESGEPATIYELAKDYGSGTPFEDCVRSLADDRFIPKTARLDFIGAGAGRIDTPERLPYGEALAKFSWTSFFEDQAGGVAIQALRDWAKRNYDLVLIDSRTGLADVAGLCTMQIPDQVALCFILNRQNIDGAAQVAAAIRARRSDEIVIRAVPMRVANRQTPEESDARARAATELNLVGGLSIESVQDDLQLLDVAQADNVPFYEALAPFVAARPAYDPLTLNYLRLANELTGRKLKAPELDEKLVEQVRLRMQPQQATIDYISALQVADPARAVTELRRLLEGAQRLCASGVMPTEAYIQALVNAVFTIDSRSLDVDDLDLNGQAVDLVRSLQRSNPMQWHGLLLHSLERLYAVEAALLEPESELALLREIDAVLTPLGGVGARIKRLGYQRKLAWLQCFDNDNDAAIQTLTEMDLLVHALQGSLADLSPEQADSVLTAELDALALRGEIHFEQGEFSAAYDSHAAALLRASSLRMESTNTELRRLVSQSHVRLAQFASSLQRGTYRDSDAATHVLEALRWADGWSTMYTRFPALAKIVIDHGSHSQALELGELVFGAAHQAHLLAGSSVIGRSTKVAIEYLHVLTQLVPIIHEADESNARDLFLSMVTSVDQTLKTLFRRLFALKDTKGEAVDDAIFELRSALVLAGVTWTPPPVPGSPLTAALRSQRRAAVRKDASSGEIDET